MSGTAATRISAATGFLAVALGAFGAHVSIDFRTMLLAASPMACPEMMYGRYCSFGVCVSRYFVTKGEQFTSPQDEQERE